MADDLDEIDIAGEKRRMGSLPPRLGFAPTVEMFRVYEDERPVWEDSQIKSVITAPGRRRCREVFDAKWIQDQRTKSSCNGFGLSGAFSRGRWRVGLQDGLILSGAYPYSKMNGGQDRGSMLEDGMEVAMKWGCPPESLVPWDQIYPHLQPKNADEEAAKNKAQTCYSARTLQGFKTGLACGYFGIAAVHVGSRYSQFKNEVCGVDSGPGNHAVCIDDIVWRNNRFEFDNPGSWGLKWGFEGRAYHTEAHYASTFGVHVFYLLPGVQGG